MRRGLGIALIIAAVAGLLAILSDSREPSEEDHLKACYAAQRSYRALRGSGSPTLGSTIMNYWHKLRGVAAQR